MFEFAEPPRGDEDRAEIRSIVLELMEVREIYSVDVWLEWKSRGGIRDKRTGVAWVNRVLSAMREEVIVGRNVTPEEHGGSRYARTYFRRAR